MVHNKLARIMGLLYPPDNETGDHEVGGERDGEKGRSDGFDLQGEGRLTRYEF